MCVKLMTTLGLARNTKVCLGIGLRGAFDFPGLSCTLIRFLNERMGDLPWLLSYIDFLSNDEHVCGLISIADTIRPHAASPRTRVRSAGLLC